MALNKLKSFRWINGTSATDYVSLNKDEFDALIELVKRGGITKDIQGYIHPINSITSYQQYLLQLNCPNLVLVDPIVESVDYNVTLDSVEMYEGTRNKINVYLIDLAALDIRIISHTIVRDNAITDEQIRNRVSIDSQNGYIVVDAARENSTWTDNVRIEILPKYEDWESELYTPKVINVLVKANKVTGAQIQTPEIVKPGSFFYPKVVLMPVDNSKQLSGDPTKGMYLVPFGENFQMTIVNDTITAYAPNEEGTYQLGCRVYAFGLDRLLADPSDNIQVISPYIQFNVTTDGTFNDISGMNGGAGPTIIVREVDANGDPIEGSSDITAIKDTSASTDSCLVYKVSNVKIDGIDRYKCSFSDAPDGYRNINSVIIIPNQVITEVSVQYIVKRPDLYQVYGDGDFEPISAVQERGGFKSGKTRIGIAIVGDNYSFIIGVASNMAPTYHGDMSGDRIINTGESVKDNATTSTMQIDAVEDFNGEQNTAAIYSAWAEKRVSDNIEGMIFAIGERTVQINGVTYHGYVPAFGELVVIANNASVINSFINTYYGISNYLIRMPAEHQTMWYVSSTKYTTTEYWVYDTWDIHTRYTYRGQNTVPDCFITCFKFDLE